MLTVDIVYSGWMLAPNGASTFVREMNKAHDNFARHGVELSVFSKDLFFPRSFDDKVDLKKQAKKKQLLTLIARHSIIGTWLLLRRLFLFHAKFIVGKYISLSEHTPDIIYFHELFTCYYYLRYRQNKKSKIYLTLHGDGDLWKMTFILFPKFGKQIFATFRHQVEKTVLSQVDAIGFVADMPRRYFCQLYSFSLERTFFVYNGIPDTSERAFTAERSNDGIISMVCVGTLCERKNQMGILKALSLLSPELQQQYRLTLVGDGEERKSLEEQAATLKTEITFVGNTNHVERYLCQADCFILFSQSEGLPISIIEAMRCGLPIISTMVAGIPELVNIGVNGYLVKPDIEELHKLFQKIAENHPDLQRMGQESRHIFEQKFMKEQMISNYCKVFFSM